MPHIRLELLCNIPVVVVVTAVVVDGDRVHAMCTTSSCFEFGSLWGYANMFGVLNIVWMPKAYNNIPIILYNIYQYYNNNIII